MRGPQGSGGFRESSKGVGKFFRKGNCLEKKRRSFPRGLGFREGEEVMFF